MNTTIQALQALYVAMGGTITDTYDDIASGAPVSDYVVIPDMINAIAEQVTANKTAATEETESSGAEETDNSGTE